MNEIRKCPKCGEEMEKGFVVPSVGQLWWTKEKHWLLGPRLVGEQITKFATPHQEAYRCEKCRLIIFQYERKENFP
jgi:hypothetical protein